MQRFFAVMLVVLSTVTVGDAQPSKKVDLPKGKQFEIRMRVCEGDPFGNREAGTLKVVAEPHQIVKGKGLFSFDYRSSVSAGQVVSHGQLIEGQLDNFEDNKIRLDISLSHTTLGTSSGEDRAQTMTSITRTVSTIRLGEIVKLRWPNGTAENQSWVEVWVREITE
jgi:hypothetical protein